MFELADFLSVPLFPKPMTRLKAEKLGLITFTSKKPCPAGHRERYTKTNLCAVCHRARVHGETFMEDTSYEQIQPIRRKQTLEGTAD
jgi:hypothetical protein